MDGIILLVVLLVACVAHLDGLDVCFSPDEREIGAEVSVFVTLVGGFCYVWLSVERLRLRVVMLGIYGKNWCVVLDSIACHRLGDVGFSRHDFNGNGTSSNGTWSKTCKRRRAIGCDRIAHVKAFMS
jgi:hypothetical protein